MKIDYFSVSQKNGIQLLQHHRHVNTLFALVKYSIVVYKCDDMLAQKLGKELSTYS